MIGLIAHLSRICAVMSAVIFILIAPTSSKGETLSIAPRQQLTQVWCWLGVGEMIFRHYGIPTVNPAGIYQCGIIGALAHGTAYQACSLNCSLCTMPAGSWQNVVWMLQEYPKKVRTYTGAKIANIEADHDNRPLSRSAIVNEIDDGNPIIAGISPSGRPAGSNFTSQHVALIIGYENNGNTLIVNDPYPFPSNVWQNPYIAAGAQRLQELRYAIDYNIFRQRLNWSESFTIKSSSASQTGPTQSQFPNFCCTQFGKLGPYPNTSVPVGGACFGTHPNYGQMQGVACH